MTVSVGQPKTEIPVLRRDALKTAVAVWLKRVLLLVAFGLLCAFANNNLTWWPTSRQTFLERLNRAAWLGRDWMLTSPEGGNTALLYREQNEIIADDYDAMRNHPGGEAVTYMVTLAGEPSIPGAKSYAEVFPFTFSVESPGPENVPFTNWDNPAQFRTDFTTGFPAGNISDADQRWALIQQDTLPAYQDLLATDPGRAQQIIASDFDDRVEQYRPTNNIPGIMDRFLDGFDAEVHQ